MKRTFLITSLVAAGFTGRDPLAADVMKATTLPNDGGGSPTLFETFRQDHAVTLADHRSHRSHSSHSSHRSGGGGGGHYSHTSHTSHRSSTGGYGSDPTLIYSPPASPPSSPRVRSGSGSSSTLPSSLYSQPSDAVSTDNYSEPRLKALSGRTELFKNIVKRVQIALLAQGLFDGPINGAVGPQTRKAIRAYQARYGLDQTGTITSSTLDSMKIPSQ